jgi:hypothetical protein
VAVLSPPGAPLAAARRRALLRGAAGLLLAGGALRRRAAAQDLPSAEYRIKAAFLCKFGNYVEWPQAAGEAFGLGMLATPALVDEVGAAAHGQTVGGRPIAVRRLERAGPLDGLHLLFVARSHATRQAEALAAAKGRPLLTVTESDAGAAAGAIINFVVVDDKVKFDISLAAAERAGLKVSARLLGVARSVTGGPT